MTLNFGAQRGGTNYFISHLMPAGSSASSAAGAEVVAETALCMRLVARVLGDVTGICHTSLFFVTVSTLWSTLFSCVVVDAESGIFKILMHEEDLLGLGKEQPGLTKTED